MRKRTKVFRREKCQRKNRNVQRCYFAKLVVLGCYIPLLKVIKEENDNSNNYTMYRNNANEAIIIIDSIILWELLQSIGILCVPFSGFAKPKQWATLNSLILGLQCSFVALAYCSEMHPFRKRQWPNTARTQLRISCTFNERKRSERGVWKGLFKLKQFLCFDRLPWSGSNDFRLHRV